MPSIEIACLGLDEPVAISVEAFALVAEPGLQSHRLPSRFQSDFDGLSGCLYHLGNPDLRNPEHGGAYFAYDLLSEASRHQDPSSFLEFAPAYLGEVQAVVAAILDASPVRQALFTSDWQFGPDWTERDGPITLSEFWERHASRKLLLNCAYALVVHPSDARLSPN